MAADDRDDDGSDLTERAKRIEERAKNPSGAGSAAPAYAAYSPPEVLKRASEPSSSNSFYEPATSAKKEPTIYQPPEERSFFSPSADERSDQARRAAQRVRRRVQGDDGYDHTSETPAPTEQRAEPAKTAPPLAAPAPKAPAARVEPVVSMPKRSPPPVAPPAPKKPASPSLMDRALTQPKSAPANQEPPKPAAQAKPSIQDALISRAAQPRSNPAAQAPAEPAASSPIQRAIDAPVAPKKPVLTKAERRLAEAQAAKAKASETPAAIEKSPAAASQPGSKPDAGDTAKAAKSASASLLKRASNAAKAKPALEKKPEVAVPSARESKRSETTQSTVASSDAMDPLEAAYIEAETSSTEPAMESAANPMVVPTSGLQTARTKAFAPFEWMIASRYMRARKKEGFVSVITGFSLLGIALGVATLIVVMAVLTGFRETLITQLLGANAHISVVSQTGNFQNYDDVASEIREVDGVIRVSPLITGQVLATGPRGHSGVFLKGMRKSDLEERTLVTSPEESQGSLADFEDDKGIAIGVDLAEKLGLQLGDFISLISPDGDITPFYATPMPRKKDYKVGYIYKVGLLEVDRGHVYMPMSEAQIYLNKQGFVDQLEVFVEDPDNVEQYTDPIFQSVRSSIGLYTWKTLNGQFIAALDIERKVMFVVLTMIILVAALNIISGLVMLVKDKARGVAIMRTMGLARGSVLRVFFICGSSIGVIGSILGVILGVTFALNIDSIEHALSSLTGSRLWDPDTRMGISEVPSNLEFTDVALTLFIALGLSFIATLFPAWKAAKTDPVEALRYE